ncbi:MAG: peptidylprolyl isomerase [Rhodobacteraceae bacterium]|nr:peptidylprolyl isomerase [Paracoccaceae bacterium]
MNAPRALTRLSALVTTLALSLCLSTQASAQSAFSPAVFVGEKVVTYFEIEQRTLLLSLMNFPGDARKEARKQLVDERLQLIAADLMGIAPSEEGMENGIASFAKRFNMEPEQLLETVKSAGLAEESLRAFLYARIAWQGVVQTRFGGSVQVTEEEVNRAIASNTGAGGVNVLLSEIIIPVTPQTAEEVRALALQLSQINSQTAFEEAAKTYSQSATKDDGGRLDWLSITKLPAQLRPILMGLGPGEVSDPIPLPNATAVFMMRGKRETNVPAPRYSAIDYAAYMIPGGYSETALQTAAEMKGRVDTCDDLYGEAFGKPEGILDRQAVTPGKLPRDYALELAKLDEGEVSTSLTRKTSDGGQALVFLMLCGRSAEPGEEISREDVAMALRNQRLISFADGYLEQLRAETTIVEK